MFIRNFDARLINCTEPQPKEVIFVVSVVIFSFLCANPYFLKSIARNLYCTVLYSTDKVSVLLQCLAHILTLCILKIIVYFFIIFS